MIGIASATTLALSALNAQAVSIPATVNARITDIGGGTFLLSPALFEMGIFKNSGLAGESRGIAEFNITSLTSPVPAAEIFLIKEVFGLNPITLNVRGYAGDGVLQASDFNAGVIVTAVPYNGAPTLSIDVTGFINGLISSSAPFAGFNLELAGPPTDFAGAVFNGTLGGTPPASLDLLEPVPEPATLLLVATSAIGLGLTRWRHRRQQS